MKCTGFQAFRLNHEKKIWNNLTYPKNKGIQIHIPCGGVAQLVRASACHAEGRGFKSRHSRHLISPFKTLWS